MTIIFYKLRPTYHPFPLFAWLIMLFQGMLPWKKNAFSHMAMCFTDRDGESSVIDVPFSGVRVTKSVDFHKLYSTVDLKARSFTFAYEDFYKWVDKHKDKEYDHLQIYGLALKMLGLNPFNKKGHDFDKLVCNEIIVSFLVEFAGLKIKDSDNWDLHMTWDAI